MWRRSLERNSSSSFGDVSQPHPPFSASTPKPLLRRKWVQEKWLIWITLLVTSIFLDCASGDVMCYECAWQGSSPLPSTADGVSDVCRPHNFAVNVVHKIKCANGCRKQALYEFENEPSASSASGTSTNGTYTNRTRAISLENMTFYVRGCQKEKKTREACENKSFNHLVYAEECVCLEDYCNGEPNGASSSTFIFPSMLSATALLAARHGNNFVGGNLNLNPGNLQLALNRNLFELSAFALIIMNFVPRF